MRLLRLCFVLLLVGCKDDVQPKPASFLRLEYPEQKFKSLSIPKYPYNFEYSDQARVIKKEKLWMDIVYPKQKATLVVSYMPVNDNLIHLFKDAEKLTFKHMIKADDIQATPYENTEKKVYGKVFEVYGDAATQIQFHATDSTTHFLTGALYFYAKPNFDSIAPAVAYLKKDVMHLMETLQWEDRR